MARPDSSSQIRLQEIWVLPNIRCDSLGTCFIPHFSKVTLLCSWNWKPGARSPLAGPPCRAKARTGLTAGETLRRILNQLKATTPEDETTTHIVVILNTQEGVLLLFSRCSGQKVAERGHSVLKERRWKPAAHLASRACECPLP